LQELEKTRKAFQKQPALSKKSSSEKVVEEALVKTTSASIEETQAQNQCLPPSQNRSQSSKTLQFNFMQQPVNQEDKENINTLNRKHSQKLEDLYNKNFNKAIRSGTSLLNIEERPCSVFPLRSPSSEQLQTNIFKKSSSVPVQDLDNLFDQMNINNESTKQPCKIEMVKNLYQKTFNQGQEDINGINENKIREDNFYRGYLMNPYGTNNANWQFNKDVFNYGIEHVKDARMSSLSINSASTTTEEESFRHSSSMKYPDLSEVDHRKLMPVKRQSNDLLQFSPSEKIYTTPSHIQMKNENLKCSSSTNENYEQVMAQLFN